MSSAVLPLLLSLLIVLNGSCTHAQSTKSVPAAVTDPAPTDEMSKLNQRFTVEYSGLLASNMWSLTHNYRSKEDLDLVMTSLQTLLSAVAAKQEQGVKTGKEEFGRYLELKDDTIRGFAALVLGVTGDVTFAPSIAKMLEVDVKDASFTDQYAYPPVTYRGQAAVALSILGSREYLPKIVRLLKSKNEYDRRGAITALGYFGAKEYAGEIVGILTNSDLKTADDPSPVYFLIQNGIIKDYKKELVTVMSDKFKSETAETAMYALVSIEAKEHSAEIAKLLSDRFRKGDAAKALALMGATEYADRIALLLTDENGLVRKDAALALGILKSKKHIPNLTNLLTAKEDYVRHYAAIALVLMEAKASYQTAIPAIKKAKAQGAYLNEGDFHPVIAERGKQIMKIFAELVGNDK